MEKLQAQPAPAHGTLEDAIYLAVVNGDAGKLKQLFDDAPLEVRRSMLTTLWSEFDGTLLYHSIDQCVRLTNLDSGDGQYVPFATAHAACADLLRSWGAPCIHLMGTPGAMMLLVDTDWDDRPGRFVVEKLMRETLADKVMDPNEPIPAHHANIGGLLPLDAAFHLGNAMATQALLDAGADLMAPLKRTGATDILEYARSFMEPRSDMVASVVAEHLMTMRLLPGASEPGTRSIVPRRRVRL